VRNGVKVSRNVGPLVRLLEQTRLSIDGCWLWQGYVKTGYGQIRIGRKLMVHRLSYELATGQPLPKKIDLHHRCQNKLCIRPSHLEPLSRSDHVLEHNKTRHFEPSPLCKKKGHRRVLSNNGKLCCPQCAMDARSAWRKTPTGRESTRNSQLKQSESRKLARRLVKQGA
jgi:hypothetical protein